MVDNRTIRLRGLPRNQHISGRRPDVGDMLRRIRTWCPDAGRYEWAASVRRRDLFDLVGLRRVEAFVGPDGDKVTTVSAGADRCCRWWAGRAVARVELSVLGEG